MTKPMVSGADRAFALELFGVFSAGENAISAEQRENPYMTGCCSPVYNYLGTGK